MFGFLKSSKNAQLDAIIQRIHMNMENNYKDAAQMNLAELEDVYNELAECGKLNDKQMLNYENELDCFKIKLKNFTHKDQKPTWV